MEWDQWLSHRMRMGRPHFYPFLEVLMHTVKGWWTLRSSSEDILQKTSQLSSFLSTPMLISWSFPSLSHCVSFLTALSLFSFSFFPFFFFFLAVLCEKAEEPETKLPTSVGSSKQQESSRKTSTSTLLTMPKPLTVWITTNWKILKEMGIPDHLTCLLRNL